VLAGLSGNDPSTEPNLLVIVREDDDRRRVVVVCSFLFGRYSLSSLLRMVSGFDDGIMENALTMAGERSSRSMAAGKGRRRSLDW